MTKIWAANTQGRPFRLIIAFVALADDVYWLLPLCLLDIGMPVEEAFDLPVVGILVGEELLDVVPVYSSMAMVASVVYICGGVPLFSPPLPLFCCRQADESGGPAAAAAAEEGGRLSRKATSGLICPKVSTAIQ